MPSHKRADLIECMTKLGYDKDRATSKVLRHQIDDNDLDRLIEIDPKTYSYALWCNQLYKNQKPKVTFPNYVKEIGEYLGFGSTTLYHRLKVRPDETLFSEDELKKLKEKYGGVDVVDALREEIENKQDYGEKMKRLQKVMANVLGIAKETCYQKISLRRKIKPDEWLKIVQEFSQKDYDTLMEIMNLYKTNKKQIRQEKKWKKKN